MGANIVLDRTSNSIRCLRPRTHPSASHLSHWNHIVTPFLPMLQCSGNRSAVRIVVRANRARVVTVRLVRVEVRQRWDGIRVGSNTRRAKIGGVVIRWNTRKRAFRACIEARSTSVFYRQRMRCRSAFAVVVKVRPLDSLI